MRKDVSEFECVGQILQEEDGRPCAAFLGVFEAFVRGTIRKL